jgi:hypothetical protein
MSIRNRLGALVAAALLGLGGVAVAAPASAAPPARWGFAFNHDPTPLPGTTMDPTRQWGSWKPAFPADNATVDPLPGVGHYLVRFPHIGVRGGVAHVTAVLGNGPAWCQLGKWFPGGADEYVEVQCYRHGGVPLDSRFAVLFSAKFAPLAVPGGAYAYVHASATGALLTQYNSTGAPNASGAGGPGFYKVLLPGVGLPGGFAGNVQVSAAEPGVPRRCKVADIGGGVDVTVFVRCVDGASAPADSAFTLTYHRERPVFGEVAPPKRFGYVVSSAFAPPPGTDFNSLGAPNAVVPSGPGQTLVRFGHLGVAQTHTQVTAIGGSPDYCVLQDVWRHIFSDGVIRNVICFNAAGAQADNPSFVTFTSRI